MHTLSKPPLVVKAGAVVEIALDLANLAWSGFEPGITLSFFLFLAFCYGLQIGAAVAAYFCRNWGRVVLLILWILSVTLVFVVPFDWPNVTGLLLLGNAVPLILLFSSPANRWYRDEAEALRAV